MTSTQVGLTLHTAGELMVAFTALMVHYRFLKEHKVDRVVLREMKNEQIIGVMGMILILMGFLLEMRGYAPF